MENPPELDPRSPPPKTVGSSWQTNTWLTLQQTAKKKQPLRLMVILQVLGSKEKAESRLRLEASKPGVDIRLEPERAGRLSGSHDQQKPSHMAVPISRALLEKHIRAPLLGIRVTAGILANWRPRECSSADKTNPRKLDDTITIALCS